VTDIIIDLRKNFWRRDAPHGLTALGSTQQKRQKDQQSANAALGEALSPKHEAFVQAYITNGMNATKAYRAVYPKTKKRPHRSGCFVAVPTASPNRLTGRRESADTRSR
jgi:hypothetical protein